MRLTLDARAQRLLRRLPQTTVYSAIEIVLLLLLAVQCARLLWAVATPVGPLGEWRATSGISQLATPSPALFEAFDPFFRLEGGGPLVVTDLSLRLYGVRENRATGRGAAIIALEDGEQASYVVGDEIMPGVILEAVGFDFVTILRDDRREQIYLDQSGDAPTTGQGATPAAPASAITPAPPRPSPQPAQSGAPAGVTPNELSRDTQISPRREGNRMTGVILQPTGSGRAFGAAGFQPGDVLISINGQRIMDAGQAARFATDLGSGEAMVQVERNGETIAFRARVSQ